MADEDRPQIASTRAGRRAALEEASKLKRSATAVRRMTAALSGMAHPARPADESEEACWDAAEEQAPLRAAGGGSPRCDEDAGRGDGEAEAASPPAEPVPVDAEAIIGADEPADEEEPEYHRVQPAGAPGRTS